MSWIARRYPVAALLAGLAMLFAPALAQAQAAPTNLRWDVSSLDFGIRAVGDASEVRTVTLTNTGSSPARSAPVSSSNPQFELMGHTCPEALPGYTSCQIQVRFVPAAGYEGDSVYGVLVVGAFLEEIQLPLHGIVASPQGLARIEIYRNMTGAARVVSVPAGVACEMPPFPCVGYVPIGATVVLQLTPRHGSAFHGWEGPCSGNGTCSFTVPAGTTHVHANVGIAASPLDASPTVVAFESQGMQSRPLTLRNPGPGAVTVTGIVASDVRFTVDSACGTVASGAECTLSIDYVPDGTPVEGAVVTIETDQGAFYVPIEVDAYDSLVSHFYQSILRRAPDAAGHDFWNGEARRLAHRVEMVEVWATMASQFFDSPEYRTQGRDFDAFLLDLYAAFMSRTPGAEELDYWRGVRDAAPSMPWQAYVTAFALSPEFRAIAESGFTARPEVNLVMDFYRGALHRLPDDDGLRHWVVRMRLAQCSGAAAVNAEADALSSAIFNSMEYNNSRIVHGYHRVADHYDAFMRRGADAAGFNYWLVEINAGGGSCERVRQAFRDSPEFQARVQAVVAAGCHPWPGEI